MGKEIEMKDADVPSSASAEQNGVKKTEADERPSPPSVKALLAANVALLEAAVRAKETRVLAGRLMRQTTAVRKRLTEEDLSAFVREKLPHGYPGTTFLLSHLTKVTCSSPGQAPHCCRRLSGIESLSMLMTPWPSLCS